MIFSVDGSIEKIKNGMKTQTRRPNHRYQVGKTYAIQPGRTKSGIPDGRIEITHKWMESDHPANIKGRVITPLNAQKEGGYTRQDFEELYEKMYPNWTQRWAYEFQFIPSEGGNP